MNVAVSLDCNPFGIDEGRIASICAFALENSGAGEDLEVSVTFVDDDEMALLNGRYRGKDGPTDVLSFECDGLDDDFPANGGASTTILGDIIIAPNVAYRQSVEYGTTLADEMDLLCVHGILHLLGYDHILDDEAKEMEDLQDAILRKWRGGKESYA